MKCKIINRILSLVLAFVMVLGMMPMMNMTAYAATEVPALNSQGFVTYTDGVIQYVKYDNYLYKVTYTNLKDTKELYLKIEYNYLRIQLPENSTLSLKAADGSTSLKGNDLPKTGGSTLNCYSNYEERVIDTSAPVVIITCVAVNEPTWNWASDHSSATAVFTASEADICVTLSTDVSFVTEVCSEGDRITYTASVTFNGVIYTEQQEAIKPHDWNKQEGLTCDQICSRCGSVQAVAHTYGNDCDIDCNVCGATRETEHHYDSDCDSECNSCGVSRETTIAHTYDYDCDQDCNACGEVRDAFHNAEDGSCTYCGMRYYGVLVAGVQITEANASDVLGDGTMSYDATTNTLILTGATVDASELSVPALEITDGTVTLVLHGDNELISYPSVVSDGETGEWGGYPAISIAECASVIITGDSSATLKLQGNDFGYTAHDHIPSAAAVSGGSLTVNGGKIIAESTGGIRLSGDYTQTGGNVSISYLEAQNVAVSGGTLESKGWSGISPQYWDSNAGGIHGIFAQKNITISGGSVATSSGVLGHDGNYIGTATVTGDEVVTHGLYALESITISGGTVTSTGGSGGYIIDNLGMLSIGSFTEDDEWIGTPAGAALEAPQWSISDAATFICGSDTSHRGTTQTCNDEQCVFCGVSFEEIDHSYDETTHICSVCGKVETFTVYWGGLYQLGLTESTSTFGQDFQQTITVPENTHLEIRGVYLRDNATIPVDYTYTNDVLTILAKDIPAADIEIDCYHYVEVKFDANGGVIKPEEGYPLPGDTGYAEDGSYWVQSGPVGWEIYLANCAAVSRTGYTFVDWRDASGKVYPMTQVDGAKQVSATEDVTLYAQWQCNHTIGEVEFRDNGDGATHNGYCGECGEPLGNYVEWPHIYDEGTGLCACGAENIAPTGTITIKNNDWSRFWNWPSFGIFCKDHAEVSVTANGTGSDVIKVEYLFSTSVLDESNMPADGWTELSESEGKYKFSIQPKNKGAVYVRITDACGNIAVINSDGIVVYEDSEAVTTWVHYTYEENSDRDITVTLNGNTVKSVAYENEVLTKNTHYTVAADGTITLKAAYLDMLNIGSYDFTVSYNPMGVENSGVTDLTTTFIVTVDKATLTGADVKVNGAYTYTGNAHTPEPVVTLNGKTLIEDVDYTVSYSNNVNAGTATVNVTGKYNYKDSASTTFTIGRATLKDVSVQQNGKLTYDGGKALTPVVTVNATALNDTKVLFMYGADGSAYGSMPTFTEAGTYTVHYCAYTADNNFIDYYDTFTVTVDKAIVNEPTISSKPYTGEAQTADVPASNLYTIEKNNGGTAKGSYDVVLKLKDAANYKWSTTNSAEVTLKFVISAAENSWKTAPSISGWTYGDSANEPVYGAKYGTVKVVYTGKANDGSDYNSETAPTKAGSYTATFTVEGTADYSGLSEQVTLTIAKATYDMSGAKWDYTAAFDYDGNEKTVTVIGLPSGVTVSGYEGNKATVVGNYTAKVTFSYDGNNYNAPVLADCNWSIKNDWTPSEYSVSTPNGNGWLNNDFTIIPAEGYLVSLTNTADGIWSDKLTCSAETDNGSVTFYLKNTTDGTISLGKTVTYKLDKTPAIGRVEFVERAGWEEFVNNIIFGLFYKDEVTVEITANDTLSGVASIEYYAANKVMTLDEVEAITDWTAYNDSFGVSVEDTKQFVYFVRITDKAGNVTYLSTDGAEYDTTAPVISGIENGKTYYTTQKVTVTDKNVASITLDGETAGNEITLDGNKNATYTIVVTDKAGNSTTVTVTMKPISDLSAPIDTLTKDNVNSGNEQAVDDVKAAVAAVDTTNATDAEKQALKDIADKAAELEKVIDDTKAEAVEGLITALPDPADPTAPVEPDDKEVIDAYEKAREAYDELTDHEKSLVDEALREKLEDLAQALASYKILEGIGANWTKDSGKTLTFKSNGYHEKLYRIEVDGKVVDAKYYEVKAGSTIITMKAEFLQTLSVGQHTFKMVYRDGECHCLFGVKAAPVVEQPSQDAPSSDAPVTGDNSNMFLWIALLLASGGAVTALTVVDKKRKAVRR